MAGTVQLRVRPEVRDQLEAIAIKRETPGDVVARLLEERQREPKEGAPAAGK